MAVSDESTTQTATIAINESLSGAVNVSGYRIGAILMPAAWTNADLTFQGSADGSAFANLYDSGGTEVQVTNGTATSRAIVPTAAHDVALRPWRQIKVRSGTSGAAVNQGAARTITLVLIPRLEG